MARAHAGKTGESLSQTLDRVIRKRERVILRRQGKEVAAVIPIEDFATLEELEDRLDLIEAKKALRQARKKGEKPIPWEKAKQELGL